jgi:hypothetical protein
VSVRPDSIVASGRAERRVQSIFVERYIISSDRYNLTYEIQSETRGVHRGGRGGATRRWARPVRPDLHAQSPRFVLCSEPNGSIRGGLLYKLVGRLLLTLLPICIDIETL